MIHIKEPKSAIGYGINKIIYPITINNKPYNIYFKYPKNTNIGVYNEGIVAIFYSIAKYNNIELKVDSPVEKAFKKSIMNINDPIARFKNINRNDNFLNKTYSRENINIAEDDKKKPLVVCPLSGGIDSLYSATKFRKEITHFFYVIGFDINHLKSTRKWIDHNISHVKSIIKKYYDNKPLLIIKTNLIIILDIIFKEQGINTETTYLTMGFCLFASVINLKDFSKIIVPGPGIGNGKWFKQSRHIIYNSFKDSGSTSFLK